MANTSIVKSSGVKRTFDPESIVQKAIDSDFDSSVFTDIDDSAIERAPNWLDWCTGKNFLNLSEVFPRQIQLATTFYGEYCPRCSKPGFIEDLNKQSMMDIRENITFLEFGFCPKCKVSQLELFRTKELKEYNELDCVVGRRGGKSSLVSMMATYHLHRIVTMPSPSRFYGIMQDDTLAFVFLAVTAKQARETLWDKFTARIDSSPWFKQYHKLLADIAKKKGVRVGDIYKYESSYLTYFHKAIHCSYYTPDITTLRGLTTVFYSIDELGYFDNEANSQKVHANAQETYGSMNTSNQTLRSSVRKLRHDKGINWVPHAVGVNISSPYSADDMIMRLLKDSSERSGALGYSYETWNMNPHITREELWDETVDKKKFWRDYACVPSIGGDRVFLSETSLVNRSIIKDKRNAFTYSFHTEIDKVDPSIQTVYAQLHVKTPDRMTPRIIGVDMGYNANSFAIVMASYNSMQDSVEIDGAVECEPLRYPNGTVAPVNTVLMFEKCIVPLLEYYNILYVVYDQWNSIESVQRIRSKFRVNAEQCSLTYNDFTSVIKSCIYDGKLRIPSPEIDIDKLKKNRFEDVIQHDTPIANLQYQMLTVQEVGRKITKPYKGNDDLFRAMALCIKYVKDPNLNHRFISTNNGSFNRVTTSGSQVIGTVRQYSADYGPYALNSNKNPVSNRIGVVGSALRKPPTTIIK